VNASGLFDMARRMGYISNVIKSGKRAHKDQIKSKEAILHETQLFLHVYLALSFGIILIQLLLSLF